MCVCVSRVVRPLYVDIRNYICRFWGVVSSEFFPSNRGGYSLLYLRSTMFSIYINGLLSEIGKCLELGVKFFENTLSGLLFAHIIIVNIGSLKPI